MKNTALSQMKDRFYSGDSLDGPQGSQTVKNIYQNNGYKSYDG